MLQVRALSRFGGGVVRTCRVPPRFGSPSGATVALAAAGATVAWAVTGATVAWAVTGGPAAGPVVGATAGAGAAAAGAAGAGAVAAGAAGAGAASSAPPHAAAKRVNKTATAILTNNFTFGELVCMIHAPLEFSLARLIAYDRTHVRVFIVPQRGRVCQFH